MIDQNIRPSSIDVGPGLESLAGQLQNRYLKILRQTLFTNRAEVRPSMLRKIAAHETQALLEFFFQPSPQKVAARGIQHAQTGLSEETILALAQTSRQFIIENLGETAVVTAMNTADAYYHALLKGFLQGRERIILDEQERMRGALQKTLRRYSVQMAVTAGIAGATASILDMDLLLNLAVELIWRQFSLLYVGLFLLDKNSSLIRLKAGMGTFGEEMLAPDYTLDPQGNSLISLSVESGNTHVVLDIEKEAATDDTLIRGTKSQAVIPLLVRGDCIGAMSLHSHFVNAFTDLELVAFKILAEQLASVISNARLFAELRQSEEKYRTILENIEEGYYEMDLNGRFTFSSDSVSHILERTHKQIIGVPYQNFFDTAHVDRVTQAFQLVQRTGRSIKSVESRIYRTNEVGRFVELSMILILNPNDEPIGVRGTIRDITERKQAEQFRIERKVLERSNRELEQFAYVASHDLQEPLNKIRLFGDRLITKSSIKLDKTGQDYLERMMKSTARMQTLIDNLLALSQVATRGRPFQPTDLSEILEEVISDLETRVRVTEGSILAESLPTIDADPIQMHQLFQNLISNGLKFHRPDAPPVIKLTAKRPVSRRGQKHIFGEEYCQIFVTDNGIGFDEKFSARIFQPFQRLHSQNAYEGTGMGLAICQRIVERHGGRITVKSSPNMGTTFAITLPVKQAENELEAGIKP
ncbi:MAG: ATP-binding protein [Candidatus Promineifilaceae bacterium]